MTERCTIYMLIVGNGNILFCSDMCGICGGDNSTCITQDAFYNETKYGYSTVVRIPAGSSSVDIRQRGHNNTARDDNYLGK